MHGAARRGAQRYEAAGVPTGIGVPVAAGVLTGDGSAGTMSSTDFSASTMACRSADTRERQLRACMIRVACVHLHDSVDLGLHALGDRALGFALLGELLLLEREFLGALFEPGCARSGTAHASDARVGVCDEPLALSELKAEAVEHELVFVGEHVGRACLCGREQHEL
jgi:hypothetical protein